MGWELIDRWEGDEEVAFSPELFGHLLADACSSHHSINEARITLRMCNSCSFDGLLPAFEWAQGWRNQSPGPGVDMKFDFRVTIDGKPRGTHGRLAQLICDIHNTESGHVLSILEAVQSFAHRGGLGGLTYLSEDSRRSR